MNKSYATLNLIKSRLGISDTGDDVSLRQALEVATEMADSHTRRHFDVRSEIRYYDGVEGDLMLDDDLLSVTTLKTDGDGNGTYETTFAASDYHLYPLNARRDPPDVTKQWIGLSTNSSYGDFGSGVKKAVELDGVWGFGNGLSATPYASSGTTTNEALDASETAVDVVSGAAFETLQTILVESEQMYITAIASNTLTVVRGVNGTTAATHDTGKTVYIYEYPAAIEEAVLMTASRLFKRKDSAYATVIGAPELGPLNIHRGLDMDVRLLLEKYVREIPI